MAGHYLQSLMSENENIILATRHHWFILARSIVLEIILILIIFSATIAGTLVLQQTPPFGFIVPVIGFILLLIPVATGTRDFLNWSNHQFIITNRRVMQLSGIFNKSVIDSSLEKVNDIKMDQTALGRMFGYGDIEILTASELGVNLFKQIDNPVKFKTALLNAKASLEQSVGVPLAVETKSDIPSMISKLADLRTQGVLTEAEFQQKKSDLLAKM
ncbi:MAG TPA: PH domain-containing protein [Anaerolineales bacterium]